MENLSYELISLSQKTTYLYNFNLHTSKVREQFLPSGVFERHFLPKIYNAENSKRCISVMRRVPVNEPVLYISNVYL